MGPHQAPAAPHRGNPERLRTHMNGRQAIQGVPLRSVIDALPLSIFWKDRDSRYLGCNDFFARAAGLPRPEAVTGLSDADMPWADKARRFREEDVRILRTGEPWRAYDEVTATRDGTRVFMRTAKVPLRDSVGQVVGVVGAYEWINHTDLAPMEMPDSEERLRALTETAAEAVVVVQDGTIVYVNGRGREIFGATQEEITGLAVDKVVHPRDRRRVRNDFVKVLSGEEPAFASLYEFRIVNRQRRVRWLQASTILIPWAGRAATLHFIIDATPSRRQRQMQEALNRASAAMAGPLDPNAIFPAVARELASIDFLMHVFTLNPDGTLSLSFLGKRPGTAADLAKIFGMPVAISPFSLRDGGEFSQVVQGRRTILITNIARLLESVLPPGLRHAVPQVVKAVAVPRMILAPLADDNSVIGMIALENADMTEGDLPAVTAFALQMGSALQRARMSVAMATENAERRRAEEERARLYTAIEQAAEYVLITDADGMITYTNPAFERVTGYSRDEARGKSPRLLKSGRQDDAFYKRMWETLVAGEVWRGQLLNRRKDGSTYLEEATISPVKARDGRIVSYVAVKRDVTEATELEERLRHAQKMEAVGRLAGGVAHDFNNILTTITGYADLLLTGLGEEDPRAAEVREILAASRRATGLTRQLLTFSRKQVISPRLVSLNAVIENLHAMLRPLIGEDVQLEYELSRELWPVLADTGQLEQVILNLSVNARDAMPDGGTLTFRTHNLRRDSACAASPDELVVLTVRDTGVGMSEEVRSHLFEPFYTTKKPGAGTGLGLATVYGIVNQSQGHIEVSSQPDRGTEFRLYFPRVPGSVSREEGEPSSAKLPRGRETILLVEDEAAVRTLTCTLLSGWGYTVLEAAVPTEAIAIAERRGNPSSSCSPMSSCRECGAASLQTGSSPCAGPRKYFSCQDTRMMRGWGSADWDRKSTFFPSPLRRNPLRARYGRHLMANNGTFLKSLGALLGRRAPASSLPAPSAARDTTSDTVERLAGGVAHDFNNILLVVRGYAELALGEDDLGAGARGHLQEVMSALQRASELVGQLLSVGRRASSSLGEIDLNESISRALEKVRTSRGGGFQASFVAGAGIPRLLASADQVERLIASLVTYATERTAKGGRLFVESSLASESPPTGQRIVLRVTAPGAVVSDDEKTNVFEPFYVSPSTGRRMGLGLAAAQGTVSLLGGGISLHNPPSGGIEFLITLPVRTESMKAPPALAGGTILIAEDDTGVRDLASRVLGKEGYRVLAARDGEEAVQLFQRNREVIRIAILDDVMPKLSGRTVLERIRETSPSLPVILCTGYAWGVQESVARPNVEETLAKPYDPRDLLRCVRRFLGNGG